MFANERPRRNPVADALVRRVEEKRQALSASLDAKSDRAELRDLFGGSSAGLVYVSCFLSRADMRKYLSDIAWETDAWCADNPSHLIHFNGERFLGPYEAIG